MHNENLYAPMAAHNRLMTYNWQRADWSRFRYRHERRVSKATATRDLQYLQDIEILQRIGAGRSTRYDLVI